jgi:hypothetical protein
MLESFSRLSQSIQDAARSADPEAAARSASLVVNAVGVMATKRTPVRQTQFEQAANLLGDAIKTARERKVADAVKPEAKSLAELLAESAQDSDE